MRPCGGGRRIRERTVEDALVRASIEDEMEHAAHWLDKRASWAEATDGGGYVTLAPCVARAFAGWLRAGARLRGHADGE